MSEEGAGAWHNHRAPLNARVLESLEPDLLGLQEAQSENLLTYEHVFPHYHYTYGLPTGQEEDPWYNPILWNPSRLTMLSTGGFYLSEMPDCWSQSWGAASVRAATWARFKMQGSNALFLFINTHLDHASEQARLESMRLILARARQLTEGVLPILLVGTFNSNPNTPPMEDTIIPPLTNAPYCLLRKAGFIDTFEASGLEEGAYSNTYHGYQGTSYHPRHAGMAWRVDWIMMRSGSTQRFVALEQKIVHDAAPPLYPSDHYPVIARLSVENQG